MLDKAIAFAADCATAYAKASDTTRKRFNDMVFTRIDVRDGHVRAGRPARSTRSR